MYLDIYVNNNKTVMLKICTGFGNLSASLRKMDVTGIEQSYTYDNIKQWLHIGYNIDNQHFCCHAHMHLFLTILLS